MHAISLNTMPLYRFTNRPFWVITQDNYCILGYIILYVHQGRMQDFSRGAHSKNFGDYGYTYMPRSGMSRAAKLQAVARGVWGHAPTKKIFLKGCNFLRFEGYFQLLS